jgi:hypothetical protein
MNILGDLIPLGQMTMLAIKLWKRFQLQDQNSHIVSVDCRTSVDLLDLLIEVCVFTENCMGKSCRNLLDTMVNTISTLPYSCGLQQAFY